MFILTERYVVVGFHHKQCKWILFFWGIYDVEPKIGQPSENQFVHPLHFRKPRAIEGGQFVLKVGVFKHESDAWPMPDIKTTDQIWVLNPAKS